MLDLGTGSTAARVRRARWLVSGISLLALAGKLFVAATTFGTNDIAHWLDFVRAVHAHGPIGIYGVSMPYRADGHVIQLYNHPPLISYFLQVVQWLQTIGLSPQFTIRAAASVADVFTALVVFELLRTRHSLRRATLSGIVVAVSPVLFIISGYHGNTDPIFILFTLLCAYLLADRNRPIAAGAALAVALSIKIVPVVVIPCLVGYALLRGRRYLERFLGGLIAVSAVIWAPAMILEGSAVRHNVLGYVGLNAHEWGIDLLAHRADQLGLASWIEGSGRLVIVAACAVASALLVLRRPAALPPWVAFALCSFLLLTPSFGTQYLVWAAAPIVLLDAWGGLAYNALAGVLLVKVYTRWNSGLPWDRAYASAFTAHEADFGLLVWAVLGAAMVVGTVREAIAPPVARPAPDPPPPTRDRVEPERLDCDLAASHHAPTARKDTP